MKTVAITGHTSGIGKAIGEWFTKRKYNVIGFSRSNGYDLAESESISNILKQAWESDVFINNAYHHAAQVDLLYALNDLWRLDPTKIIVTIGSMSSEGIKNFRHPYAVYKTALDKAVEQLQNVNNIHAKMRNSTPCRIVHIRPSWVDTSMITHVTERKMTAQQVAEIVGWAITQPVHIRSLSFEA